MTAFLHWFPAALDLFIQGGSTRPVLICLIAKDVSAGIHILYQTDESLSNLNSGTFHTEGLGLSQFHLLTFHSILEWTAVQSVE